MSGTTFVLQDLLGLQVLDMTSGLAKPINKTLNSCNAFFTKQAVPAHLKPSQAGAADVFYLKGAESGLFVGPVYNKASGPNASTLFNLGGASDTADALLFSERNYPAEDGLPDNILVMWFDSSDEHTKGMCNLSGAPHRVYEDPALCGHTAWSAEDCGVPWLYCDFETGYCNDVALRPPKPDPNAPLTPNKPTTLIAFPNCVQRRVFRIVPASHVGCTVYSPEANPAAVQEAKEKAQATMRVYQWVAIGVGILTVLVCFAMGFFMWHQAIEARKARAAIGASTVTTPII